MVRIDEDEIPAEDENHWDLFEAESPEEAFEDWLKYMVRFGPWNYELLRRLSRVDRPIEVARLIVKGGRGLVNYDWEDSPQCDIPPLALEALIASSN